ncbi:MAG TPA: rod shape-determining protein MreD [Candidatus Thioglobus sp.]|jgi:rod shape-determining protein MreD|nr:rod shape-determining protein MreD [Candidatus Thioglobus sp.]HIL21068.1 rod shape-determining protein MreD [Candidatus Thioglobus sp.]
MNRQRPQILLFKLTLISALLSAVALPEMIQNAAPFWMLIFFTYWLIYAEAKAVYTLALMLGLLLDLLHGNVFGQNALALIASTVFILNVKKSFYVSNLSTQQVYVFVASLIYLLTTIGVHWIIQGFDFSYLTLLAPLTGAILWPIVHFLLAKLKR